MYEGVMVDMTWNFGPFFYSKINDGKAELWTPYLGISTHRHSPSSSLCTKYANP